MPGASGDYGGPYDFTYLGRLGISSDYGTPTDIVGNIQAINDYGTPMSFSASGLIDFNYMSKLDGVRSHCRNSYPDRNILSV